MTSNAERNESSKAWILPLIIVLGLAFIVGMMVWSGDNTPSRGQANESVPTLPSK